MLWSKAFIPTLKEVPTDAQVKSHILMLRAGLIRQLCAGIYTFLPLGWRSMLRVMDIIREEMDAIGGQEIFMPSTTPLELWAETGRDADMGEIMYRIEDRKGTAFALAPTHEEVITDIARGEIRSYKELPQVWYQIQNKFRDEPRPRSGVLRVREFLMKDAYTLCADEEQLHEEYKKQEMAYRRIFDRCGLQYFVVGASSGLMGGTGSEEFMVPSESGEDIIATCECGFAQNLEVAKSVPTKVRWKDADKAKVHTPEQRTIEQVSEFLGLPEGQLLKSLLYITQSGKPVMACLRGDHDLSEDKLQSAVGEAVRPAEPEEALKITGAPIGFLGPISLADKLEIIVDSAVEDEMPFATGANEVDYHITGYSLADIGKHRRADIRAVAEGDLCIACGKKLDLVPTIEIGHIFKLGTKYSKPMGATFLDEEGTAKPIQMGSYGIGVGRILAGAIELFADEDGICWPITIAPFEVIITPVNVSDEAVMSVAMAIYEELIDEGVEVLLDDREARPGVKFKDADLIGAPIRITVGKGVKDGVVELIDRKAKESENVPIEDAVEKTLELWDRLFAELSDL
ncbi:MAG TPA: proline--tRNA ligase [candidate division Zixibacteria bacterium]|nr:proline--tRNA ligase [candidate division Zixibacteria bacterium]